MTDDLRQLVANRFTQVPGMDYGESYSPVIKNTSLMLLIDIGVEFEMETHHCNFSTTFLIDDVKDEAHMTHATEYEHTSDDFNRTGDKVYMLNKSLYDFKLVPHVWEEAISKVLFTFDSRQCVNEPCLF